MADKGLSIVIVSYQNLGVLRNCLDSVFAMNDIGDRLQVIVVEQSPTDDIYHYLLRDYPQVDAIRADNKGFGAGNNRGVEIAKYDYLLLLNPDTILVEPIAAFAIKEFETNQNLGLFGVRLLNADRTKGSSFQYIAPYGIWAKLGYRLADRFDYFSQDRMYIAGADIFVRRDLFKETGGFDEQVFMYCEEAELCCNVRKAGYGIAFYICKEIIHLQGACSTEHYGRIFEHQMKAFQHFCDKNGYSFKKIMGKELRAQRLKVTLFTMIGKSDAPSCRVAQQKCEVIAQLK